jgi:hypothetical protein
MLSSKDNTLISAGIQVQKQQQIELTVAIHCWDEQLESDVKQQQPKYCLLLKLNLSPKTPNDTQNLQKQYNNMSTMPNFHCYPGAMNRKEQFWKEQRSKVLT